jgi:hypothetical protein
MLNDIDGQKLAGHGWFTRRIHSLKSGLGFSQFTS